MYSEKAQKALLLERLLGFLGFCWSGVGRFCRVNMDNAWLSMFLAGFGLKKMNTFHLSMVSFNISPRVQSASCRQALYDLDQRFIDRSGWTAEQFFEIIAFDI